MRLRFQMARATEMAPTTAMPTMGFRPKRRKMAQVSGLAPSQIEEIAAAPPVSKLEAMATWVIVGARSVAM